MMQLCSAYTVEYILFEYVYTAYTVVSDDQIIPRS